MELWGHNWIQNGNYKLENKKEKRKLRYSSHGSGGPGSHGLVFGVLPIGIFAFSRNLSQPSVSSGGSAIAGTTALIPITTATKAITVIVIVLFIEVNTVIIWLKDEAL